MKYLTYFLGLLTFKSSRFPYLFAKKDLIITAQNMKFSIKDFFSKCDQIRSFLRIWLHLLKKSLIENFIFCAVNVSTLDVKQRALLSAHRNLADPWSIWQNNRIKFFEAYKLNSLLPQMQRWLFVSAFIVAHCNIMRASCDIEVLLSCQKKRSS